MKFLSREFRDQRFKILAGSPWSKEAMAPDPSTWGVGLFTASDSQYLCDGSAVKETLAPPPLWIMWSLFP